MKSTFYLLPLILLFSCSKLPETKWKLIWKDDFLKKEVDTSNWSYIDRNYAIKKSGISFDIKSCVKVDNGILILTALAIQNNNAIGCGLQTKSKKTIRYGKIEVKAKFGSAQGINSALWMLADNPKYGKDKEEYKKFLHYNGEIDIVEHINFSSDIYHTVHSYFTYKLKINTPPQKIKLKKNVAEYHVYSIEIHKDIICFFVDGYKTFEYPRLQDNDPEQFPFDQDYYLLMEHGLGEKDSWQGIVNNKDLPINMHIDWVKFYEKIEP